MNNTPSTLGKYQIKSTIGQGAMGIVYEGFDPIIERTVAIKVLHAHHCEGEHGKELTKRFRREAQAAARCLHKNIVTVFDYGTFEHQDYIVMEYIEGEELSHFLHPINQLSVDETIFITTSVLHALDAAHQHKIVHRDIKPANIILLNNGEVKVADFGVALLDQSDLTMVGNMVGTPNYMSPEGLRGEIVTNQADIYSTGMVLLEMLTGARLSPQQLYTLPIKEFIDKVFSENTHIETSLQQVIYRALAANIDDRFNTASDFLNALENLASIEQNAHSTIIAKEAIQTKSKELIKLPKEILNEIEANLTGYLGPIASILIKKTSTNSTCAKGFMNALANHIADEKERQQFIEKATKTLEQEIYKDDLLNESPSTSLTRIQEPHAAQNFTEKEEIPQEKLQQLVQALAFYIGPLAKHQVKRKQLSSNNYNELCEQLADLIKNIEDRKTFLANTTS